MALKLYIGFIFLLISGLRCEIFHVMSHNSGRRNIKCSGINYRQKKFVPHPIYRYGFGSGQEYPKQENPIQENPIQENPTNYIPIQENPINYIPIQENPIKEIPIKNNPIQENPIQDIKKKLLEGVEDGSFGVNAFSSFNFAPPFESLLNKQSRNFGVFGNYGKGKICAFGHPALFNGNFLQNNFIKRLVQNILKWMTGGRKESISVGLLSFNPTDWQGYGWDNSLGLSISSKAIDKPEDFNNHDIILVGYYGDYPKQMTSEAIEKLRQYVHNGGNLFFGSHGWVWEHYGEYTRDKSLVYEKNFLNYVILKAFGIELIRDSFCVPYYDFSSDLDTEKTRLKEIKKKLLEGVEKGSYGGRAFSSFNFAPPFTTLLNKQSQSFGIFGEYGRGKISAFGHPYILFDKQNFLKRFLQNILNWMTGGKKHISIGLLSFHSIDWSAFCWDKFLDMQISVKVVETAQDFPNQDIILVGYHPDYPKEMTSEAIEKLRQYVHNGGNLFFGSHGWVWEHYGEYTRDKSLVYEKNFLNYVILKAFGIELKRDYFNIPDYDQQGCPLEAK